MQAPTSQSDPGRPPDPSGSRRDNGGQEAAQAVRQAAFSAQQASDAAEAVVQAAPLEAAQVVQAVPLKKPGKRRIAPRKPPIPPNRQPIEEMPGPQKRLPRTSSKHQAPPRKPPRSPRKPSIKPPAPTSKTRTLGPARPPVPPVPTTTTRPLQPSIPKRLRRDPGTLPERTPPAAKKTKRAPPAQPRPKTTPATLGATPRRSRLLQKAAFRSYWTGEPFLRPAFSWSARSSNSDRKVRCLSFMAPGV